MEITRNDFKQLYQTLRAEFGPQGWWPADNDVEMLCGMILVQNTNWQNVDQSLANLRQATNFDLATILGLPEAELQGLIRPSGFYRNKARAIRNVLTMYRDEYPALRTWATSALRKHLLAIKGVGFETADVMLVYLFDRAVMVADNYARRVVAARWGLTTTYQSLWAAAMADFPLTAAEAKEFHALLDEAGKRLSRR